MAHHRVPPVRLLLVGLVLVAVIPLACLAGWLVWADYLAAKARTEEATLGGARQLARDLDRQLAGFKPALDALASSPDLERGDLPAFHAHGLKFLQNHPEALNVALVDPQGRQVLNTARPPGSPAVPGQPAVVALLRTGEFAVTPLFLGPVLGRPLLAVAVPVPRVDGTRYALSVGLSPALFEGVLTGPIVAPTWTASVVDPNGLIVARVPARPQFVGQPATPEIAAAVRQRREGTLLASTKEGTPVLAVFSKAAKSGYAIVIGVPQKELLAPARHSASLAAGGAVLVLVLSLVIAVRLARRIAEPLAELATAARESPHGHVPGASRLGFQEAEQLRLAMNISAAELQATHVELERVQAEVEAAVLAQMGDLIEASFDAVLLTGAADMRIYFANRAAQALFGRDRRALVGMDARELFKADAGSASKDVTRGAALGPDGTRRGAELKSTDLTLVQARFKLVVLRPVEADALTSEASAAPAR